jgi:DNA-directed RNA polymerase subunit beta
MKSMRPPLFRSPRDGLPLLGLPAAGQTTLFDGRTGAPFDKKVTVGLIYMMKLHHAVDE